jgi:hypothetical protein
MESPFDPVDRKHGHLQSPSVFPTRRASTGTNGASTGTAKTGTVTPVGLLVISRFAQLHFASVEPYTIKTTLADDCMGRTVLIN